MQMGGAMRKVLTILVACLACSGLADGVLDELVGEFTVTGIAVNASGVKFIELSETPMNVELALREGVYEEDKQRLAIFTPDDMVRSAHVIGDEVVYFEVDWIQFVQNNSVFFRTNEVTFEREGNYLNEDAFQAARNTKLTRLYAPALPRKGVSSTPRNGCVSSTNTTGSTMTCYSNGKVTYRSVCTVNPVTYAINCRSDSY